MKKIVYYVASSIDGFICDPNQEIDGFVGAGNGVQQYLSDLNAFDTVIMGRNTYEFGYRFGLKPGEPAYAHMKHYIFSNTLRFTHQHPNVHICKMDLSKIMKLKQEPGTDIYLCGGGEFAGWLLDNKMIDVLKLKLNPLILGEGIRLFGKSKSKIQTKLIETTAYDEGLKIITYDLSY